MKFISVIRSAIWRLTWRKKLCLSCSNLEIVSNYSPCYQCKRGCNYEELNEVLNDER